MSTDLHPKIEALAQNEDFIDWVQSGADESKVDVFLVNGVDKNDITEAKQLVEFISDPVDLSPKQFDSEKLFKRINASLADESDLSITNKSQNRLRIIRFTSIAIAAVITALVIMRMPLSTASYNTEFAEQLNVDLPDGSNMILNAVTETAFSKKSFKKERTINLDGEAFFDVKKGSTFKVNTSLGTVEVLGTSFNVFARDDKFEVSCATGKVKVSTIDGSSFVILEPGQECVLDQGKITKVNHVFDNQEWINGVYHFKETELKSVVEEIERQFDVQIDISQNVDTILYNGYFENSNLDTALESVLWPLRLDYESNAEGQYRIYRKQSN